MGGGIIFPPIGGGGIPRDPGGGGIPGPSIGGGMGGIILNSSFPSGETFRLLTPGKLLTLA